MCCPHGVEVNESRNVPQADTLYTLILFWDIKNLRTRLGNLGTWVEKESRGFKVILFTQWNLVSKVFKGLWAPIKDIIIIEGGRKTLGEFFLGGLVRHQTGPAAGSLVWPIKASVFICEIWKLRLTVKPKVLSFMAQTESCYSQKIPKEITESRTNCPQE